MRGARQSDAEHDALPDAVRREALAAGAASARGERSARRPSASSAPTAPTAPTRPLGGECGGVALGCVNHRGARGGDARSMGHGAARPGAEAEQPQGQPQEPWEGQRQGQSQGQPEGWREAQQGEERWEERQEAAEQPPTRERPPSVRRNRSPVGDCSCGPDTSGVYV